MLTLSNFVITPGNRKGEKRVYARVSDGSLRRIKDPAIVRAVLLRAAARPIQGGKRMDRITLGRKAFYFGLLVAAVFVIALTIAL